ncbi:phage tail-collar fiber domain-containing protein [Vibrio navarrensis]|uniref:phage tail-collar fiber domain-containing protein n=1 Tax=Vibrio navarrensis TaxID=29495 RepID=UPI00186A57BC|nr:phage tail protein [Vibrio navarrensis]MBE4579850.1 hypothetical protein [Vibrio navarrensis]
MTQTPENQQQYGSILTVLGENAEQNGKLKNKQISFTHIAIGDANDTYVQPDRSQTVLVNELARIPVNSVDVLQPTPDSVPMLKVEAILPDNVNDLIIREFAAVATFDGNTYFHAVGNCARIYVPPPVNNGNVLTPVTLEMIFVITSADPIIEIDPNVVTASRDWVSDGLKRQSGMILDKDYISGSLLSLKGKQISGHTAIQVDNYPTIGKSQFYSLVPQYDGFIKNVDLSVPNIEFSDGVKVKLSRFLPQQFIAVEPKEFDSVQSLFSHLSLTRQQCITSQYGIDIDSEVRTGNNTKFIGTGTNFGTQIRGGKDSSFIMDGFHNVLSDLVFMIENCESPTFFEMNSYTNILKNVWFHNAGSKGEGRQTIVKLSHGGDCLLEDVKIRPKGVTAGRTSTGILVDMPIINGGSVAHRAKLVRPDVEGMTDCIHVKNGSADIYSPHIERIGSVGLIVDDGAEAVVHGGDFIYGGGSGIPIIQKGSGKLTLISPNFYRPDGSDKKLVIIQGDASQCVFINVDPDLVGYDIGAVGYPKFVTSDRRGNLNYINPYMNELSTGSKTLLFRVKKFAQGEFINDIELDVFADSKQYTIIKRKYTLTIASLDGLIKHTGIKQIYENKVSSGNYAFDFTVSAELEGSSIVIYITPTLTGNPDLQGSTVNVNARLMLQGNTKYTQVLDS